MIDRKVVQEQYERMTDGQLISLANEDSTTLTANAFNMLKQEFQKRKLDSSIIHEAEINRSTLEFNRQKANELAIATEVTNALWIYAFDRKERGASNSKIYNGLISKIINPDFALFIINELEAASEKGLKNSNSNLTIGFIFIIGGIILYPLLNVLSSTILIYFAPATFIIIGIVGIYLSDKAKSKFKRILDNIQAERAE